MALVVDLGPNPVHQVGALPFHILTPEAAVLLYRVEEQVPQQGRGGLQNRFPARRIGVIQETACKANTLNRPFFTDVGLDGAAVQLVQRGGQGFHIRRPLRSAPKNEWHQRVQGGRLLPQRGKQRGAQQTGLKFFGMHRRQMNAGHQVLLRYLDHRWTVLSLLQS